MKFIKIIKLDYLIHFWEWKEFLFTFQFSGFGILMLHHLGIL